MKNWFGLDCHPTDTYLHWTMKDKEREKTALTLRAAYDKIVAAGLKEELDILTHAAYNSGSDDERDSNAGPEL